jgi:hypothetical protein
MHKSPYGIFFKISPTPSYSDLSLLQVKSGASEIDDDELRKKPRRLLGIIKENGKKIR